MYNGTFLLKIAPIFNVVALAEGRNSVEQKVPNAGHYRFIVPVWLTNEFPTISVKRFY